MSNEIDTIYESGMHCGLYSRGVFLFQEEKVLVCHMKFNHW